VIEKKKNFWCLFVAANNGQRLWKKKKKDGSYKSDSSRKDCNAFDHQDEIDYGTFTTRIAKVLLNRLRSQEKDSSVGL